MDGVDELRVESEGVWQGALGITELAESHGAGLVDPHQQPVQPHHWSSIHPVLDVLHQTGGREEAAERLGLTREERYMAMVGWDWQRKTPRRRRDLLSFLQS